MRDLCHPLNSCGAQSGHFRVADNLSELSGTLVIISHIAVWPVSEYAMNQALTEHRLFDQRRAQPSMSRPLAATQLPATRTTIRVHWRRRGMMKDVKSATTTKTESASPKRK